MPPENEEAEMEGESCCMLQPLTVSCPLKEQVRSSEFTRLVGQNGSMIVHESGEQAAVNGSKVSPISLTVCVDLVACRTLRAR